MICCLNLDAQIASDFKSNPLAILNHPGSKEARPDFLSTMKGSICESSEGVKLPNEREVDPGKVRLLLGGPGNSGVLLISTVRGVAWKLVENFWEVPEILGSPGRSGISRRSGKV